MILYTINSSDLNFYLQIQMIGYKENWPDYRNETATAAAMKDLQYLSFTLLGLAKHS